MTLPCKTLPTALACVLAAATAARAAQPGMEPAKQSMLDKAFVSTIQSTYPDGRQAELWLDQDGSYTAEGRRHEHSSGHWQVKGDKICLRQARPIPAPFSFCTPAPATGAERPWTAKAWTGETVTVRMLPGRNGAEAAEQSQKKASDEARPDPKG